MKSHRFQSCPLCLVQRWDLPPKNHMCLIAPFSYLCTSYWLQENTGFNGVQVWKPSVLFDWRRKIKWEGFVVTVCRAKQALNIKGYCKKQLFFVVVILKCEVIQLCALRAEQTEMELCCQISIPSNSKATSKLLSTKSWNMLTYMCHLARKRKEKSDNNTFCTRLLSAPSHADSQNELQQ